MGMFLFESLQEKYDVNAVGGALEALLVCLVRVCKCMFR
jgi:hypothetical protein